MADASPPGDTPNTPYWDAAARGELRLPRCLDCGHVMFPASEFCTECLSSNLEWSLLTGLGTVVSFIVYHRAWHPDFTDRLPYNVAIIEVEEGPQIISTVIGCETADITVGMAVTVVFEPDRGMILPKFIPWSSQ